MVVERTDFKEFLLWGEGVMVVNELIFYSVWLWGEVW